jgi:hypothetical protein
LWKEVFQAIMKMPASEYPTYVEEGTKYYLKMFEISK